MHAETNAKQLMVLETELFEQKGSVVLQRLLVGLLKIQMSCLNSCFQQL